MERIICDTYVKGEKHTWSADKDNWSNQDFNRKILAVNEMYGWLYEKGILRDVSFEIRDYSDVTFFALDVKDLEPHLEAMAASGVKDADIAVRHIFDEHYTPCEYSGAIELGWTMMGYRDVDGCVGRSWECGLLKGLNSRAAHDVRMVLDEKGVKEAVSVAFTFAGFVPSDITKDGAQLSVMPLSASHQGIVEKLDKASWDDVAFWFEAEKDAGSNAFAWGLFKDNEPIGYCTIGGVDELFNNELFDCPGCSHASLILNDVFVLPKHRGQGCGAFLVNEAISLRTKNDKQLVFLTLLDEELRYFYEKLGFSWIGNGVMVRDERSLEEKKFEKNFERAFQYFSKIDANMLDQRDYLHSHGEKLIECYERAEHIDLMGVDFWARFEVLLGKSLDFDEYQVVNAVLDGDPHDIEESDGEKIMFLREALEEYRNEGYMWEPKSVLSLIEGAILRTGEPEPSKDRDKEIEYGPW